MRDLGTTIEFWVQAGYTNFWWNGLDFSFSANGNTANVSINYSSGAPWVKVGSASVSTSQTVYFRLLTATGTSSLAGPTTVSRYFDRGSPPSAPSAPSLSSITSTSMYVTFSDGSNGGVAIDQRQIGYSYVSSNTPNTYASSDGSTTITGLKPKTTYYVWARTHNSKGWSPWSAMRSAKTLDVPDAPSTPTFDYIAQASVTVLFKDNANNGAGITARQISYNTTNSHTGETIVSSDGSTELTGLDPGLTYYVWARTYNSVGWSAWSGVGVVQLRAGGWVNVNGVWTRAVPYVNNAGVWELAEGWGRNGGYWKQTAD